MCVCVCMRGCVGVRVCVCMCIHVCGMSMCTYVHNCLAFETVVSIDVPWGRISGKAWGSPSGRPVLSLHGMD